ncbi:MFS transporter [Nitratireductor sp. ZSWI3]|uniref:MFS transporter n=1 Tax=Nitratireductor sp. ZSWI3 TaxID=2966359 RepID=UPI00214F8B20|nr:MFS transporter [Nitratireductor sp. ZSWI3]MCR4265825.1 MFS transporter [Nitratireductor sp. ZSWI3]
MSLIRDFQSIARPISGFVALGSFAGTLGALLPHLQAGLDISHTQLGHALIAMSVGMVPGLVLGARLTNRAGALHSAWAIASFGAAVAALGIATGIVPLIAFFLLAGMTHGIVDIAINAEVSTIEAKTKRQLMQLAHTFFALPFGVCALLAGMLASFDLPFKVIFLLNGAGILALGVLTARTKPSGDPVSSTSEQPSLPVRAFIPLTMLLGGVILLAFSAEQTLQSWSAIHLLASYQASTFQASLGPATVGFGLALGRFGAQLLSQRVREDVLVMSSTVCAALGIAVFSLSWSTMVGLASLLLATLGYSVLAPTVFGAAGRAAPARLRGSILGAVIFIGAAGMYVVPGMVGYAADVFSLSTALAAVAVVMLLALPLWIGVNILTRKLAAAAA